MATELIVTNCMLQECLLKYLRKEQTQKQPSEVVCKKNVLKNFLNFTGKHLCWTLFLMLQA